MLQHWYVKLFPFHFSTHFMGNGRGNETLNACLSFTSRPRYSLVQSKFMVTSVNNDYIYQLETKTTNICTDNPLNKQAHWREQSFTCCLLPPAQRSSNSVNQVTALDCLSSLRSKGSKPFPPFPFFQVQHHRSFIVLSGAPKSTIISVQHI